MGWLLVPLAFACLALVVVAIGKQSRRDLGAYVIGFVVVFVISIIFANVGAVVYTAGPSDNYEGCSVDPQIWNIASAVRGKDVNGSFFLGTGSIDSVDQYYVYLKTPKGLLLQRFDTRNTYVVETNDTPTYERDDHMCKFPVADFMWGGDHTTWYYGQTGTLHVPKNTVLKRFAM